MIDPTGGPDDGPVMMELPDAAQAIAQHLALVLHVADLDDAHGIRALSRWAAWTGEHMRKDLPREARQAMAAGIALAAAETLASLAAQRGAAGRA